MGVMEPPRVDGQLIVTPHPVLLDGQRHLHADLRPGESLYGFLSRHVDTLDGEQWIASIGGREVPRHLWHNVKPKHGQLIELRGALGKTALYIVAMIALTYFTFGLGSAAGWGAGAAAGAFGGGVAGAVFASAVFVAGSMLINKVLAPKAPGASASTADQVNSIAGARNQVRPFEPLPLNFGTPKITPDIASLPYSWYEGDDQYLGMVLTPGFNVHSVDDLYLGDALLSTYEGVTVWHSGFDGMPEETIPLYSNVDTVDGAELPDTAAWVQRTTSADTVRVQINIEYILGGQGTSGKNYPVSETVQVEYSPPGANQWSSLITRTFTSSKLDTTKRATLAADVARGQYDLRVRILGQGNYQGGNTQRNDFQWSTLGSVQADDADYTGIPRIGIRIKATGQLNGTPDEIRCVAHSKPCPVWTGTAWVVQETSNPGANILQYARGYYDSNGRLLAGMGLDDEMIDIPALQAFMLHCQAHGFTYDYYIKSARSHDEMVAALALVGMGEWTWSTGRFSVAWASDDQPLSGVVNMGTIKKGSFQVDYTLANPADGIEYSYYDKETWTTKPIRVVSPTAGYATALNPAQVSGEGVTTAAHAAILARWHQAQSTYQYKDIGYSTDLEYLSYRRMTLLKLQHDLTQWGYGGRVRAARRVGGVVSMDLDDAVPPPATGSAYVGVRIPGELTMRVMRVQAFAGESRTTITLAEAWPSDAALPGDTADNPAHDTLWFYDFKQTPGYGVRVVAIEPESDLKGASVSVVPEGPEFWDYVLNGVYTPPANQSLLQTRPIASNLKISEEQVVQGDTVYTQLVATFDISGPVGHTVVLSDLDGNAELEQVADTVTRTARWRIPAAGTYPIVVRPFSPDGNAGIAATTIYTTIGADAPPVLVDYFDVEDRHSGVRRYSWGFSSDTIQSANFAGVEIRYMPGQVSAPAWDDMTPLGVDGYHAAAFESIVPVGGVWTFACRSRNTNGTLSTTAKVLTKTLGKNLDEQMAAVETGIADAFAAVNQEVLDRIAAIIQVNQELAAQDALLDVLGAQVGDILDADDWDADKAYVTGDIVKHDGKLLRALQDAPIGTAIDDPAFWQSMGDYSSVGEALAATIAVSTQNTSDIETVATQVDGIAVRMPAGTDQLGTASAIDAVSVRVGNVEGDVQAAVEAVQQYEALLVGNNAGDTDWNAGETVIYAGAKSVWTVIADGNFALTRRFDTLEADYNAFSSNVTVRLDSFASNLEANSNAITQLTSQLAGKAEATALQALQTQVTNQDGTITANSNAITQVTASVAGKADASVVQSLSTTVSTMNGQVTGILAQYFLSVDVNGRIGGMKIGNNGTTIDFDVLADRFRISSPAGGARTEYSLGNWRVYNSVNVLVTRMGTWT